MEATVAGIGDVDTLAHIPNNPRSTQLPESHVCHAPRYESLALLNSSQRGEECRTDGGMTPQLKQVSPEGYAQLNVLKSLKVIVFQVPLV